MSTKETVINDSVHGPIVFNPSDETDQLLIKLISTPEIQRLRRVRQLGFGYMVYPGAEHSRFGLLLGTMHVARKILDHLEKQSEVDEEHRKLISVAALVHDVGHGPFSHAFEFDIPGTGRIKHERWSAAICESEETAIGKILASVSSDFPEKVASVIQSEAKSLQVSMGKSGYLSNIVSSQLDADRFDYLLRDSRAAGVTYGSFDLDWLIRNIVPNYAVIEKYGQIAVGYKARHTLEQYLYARHFMHHTVYFIRRLEAQRKYFKRYLSGCFY